MLTVNPRDREKLIDPLYRTSNGFRAFVVLLLLLIGWGGVMYGRQLTHGLVETGLNRPAFWGIYMVNFIFLIGVSMAGTLIAAALHLTGAEWRRPITRIAETLTVFGLLVAVTQIMFDMGRPEQLLNVVRFGRLQSPLLWDVASLSVYILTATFALYLQLLPDIAILRDNVPETAPAWRRNLYTRLALGWRGNRAQWQRLERVMTAVSLIIIPIGISLHTITSWIFSTTVQPGWKSTILGPYFVVGAVFSGIGVLFIVMTIARQRLGLQAYVEMRHYLNLGWLFIIMSAVWIYFTLNENLSMVAWQEDFEHPLMESKFFGGFAPGFWGMVGLMVVAFWILVAPKLLPLRLNRVSLFQRWPMVGQTAVIIFLGFILLSPDKLPSALTVSSPDGQLGLWLTVLLLILSVGVGTAVWFKEHFAHATVVASIFVVVGMWLERWNIIVPTVTHPRLVAYTTYRPTMTEIAITAGSFALLALLVTLFFKIFPVVSIWEVEEGRVVEAEQAKVTFPMPEPTGKRRRRGVKKLSVISDQSG